MEVFSSRSFALPPVSKPLRETSTPPLLEFVDHTTAHLVVDHLPWTTITEAVDVLHLGQLTITASDYNILRLDIRHLAGMHANKLCR